MLLISSWSSKKVVSLFFFFLAKCFNFVTQGANNDGLAAMGSFGAKVLGQFLGRRAGRP